MSSFQNSAQETFCKHMNFDLKVSIIEIIEVLIGDNMVSEILLSNISL